MNEKQRTREHDKLVRELEKALAESYQKGYDKGFQAGQKLAVQELKLAEQVGFEEGKSVVQKALRTLAKGPVAAPKKEGEPLNKPNKYRDAI